MRACVRLLLLCAELLLTTHHRARLHTLGSFLLSRREKKLGSPEKPLSALGKVAYTKYWKASIVDCITRSGEAVSVGDLAVGTGMHHSDVIR